MAYNETFNTSKENTMFKTTLKYSINPEKQTVSLTPTAGTIVRAFAPSLVIWGGLLAYGSFLQYKENKELDENTNSEN